MLTDKSRPLVAAAAGITTLLILRRALRTLASSTARNKLNLQLPVPEDIEISQSVVLTPVRELFRRAFGLGDEEVFSHGLYKGKLALTTYDKIKDRPDGHYVVVVGISKCTRIESTAAAPAHAGSSGPTKFQCH